MGVRNELVKKCQSTNSTEILIKKVFFVVMNCLEQFLTRFAASYFYIDNIMQEVYISMYDSSFQ